MRDFNIFHISVLIIFVVFATAGVFFFASGNFSDESEVIRSNVLIWGTVPKKVMDDYLSFLRTERDDFQGVTYVEKSERTLSSDFINALSVGSGPDLILISQDEVLLHANRVLTVPYENFSERAFKDTFIEEGELFITNSGFVALPFTVDPLVMYWNRDIFSSYGVSEPPTHWDFFFNLSPRITERDQSSNIRQSFAALGEYRNIENAREILSALIIQAGNPITTRDERGSVRSILGSKFDFTLPPAEAALRFYTEFSNPVKSVYSWNRALPSATQSFIAGDLAVYIGFASERAQLAERNPNLNFDVAPLPQSRTARTRTTYGNIKGFAISRTSADPGSAFNTALILTGGPALSEFTRLSGLPPVRRDLLAAKPTDAAGSVFYDAALMARGYLAPERGETEAIFRRLIESTVSGAARLSEAVSRAEQEFNSSLDKL